MDTQTEGTPIVVYNPLSHERTDIVEGSVYTGRMQTKVRVLDPEGNEVLSQVTGYDFATRSLHFIFAATVPSLGYAVYEARVGEESSLTSDLSVEMGNSQKRMANGKYRISVNSNGDISNLYDLQNRRTLINTAIRQQLIYDHEDTWPAWEVSYTDVCRTPSSYVSKNVEIELVEDGPLRKSLKVKRQQEGSTFIQYIRMNAVNDRIECVNEVDWQTYERMLKVNFPFYASTLKNARTTYDISLGTISRGIRTSDEYEVCGNQWADQSNTSNSFGVSILSDCKYGWDKPNDTSLRLTLLRTPSCKNYDHQANMDLGPNKFTYALFPHDGGWSEQTQMQAGQLNQPLIAFVAPKHAGALGRRVAFASLSTDKVAIKVLKKAEDTDELIVRVYEWVGEDQQNVRLSFPVPIVSAREVNGIEEEIGSATTDGNDILFNIGHYQPKTFAVRLQTNSSLSGEEAGDAGSPVALTYNIDMMSYDKARGSAASTYTYAYPAELISDTLTCDGVDFLMGPRDGSARNAVRLSSTQTIALNRKSGENKLYLLLASPTEAGAKVTVTAGEEETVLDVPYFTGRAAEPPSCTTITENYRKQNIVFASSHAHKVSDKTNQTMQMLYIYKYGIALPDDINEVTISSSDHKTFLFAATTAANQADDVVAFTPLTTEIESSMPDAQYTDDRLVPSSVSASHQINTNEAARYANDQDPTTKWCVGGSQSQTPWLQYILKDTAVVNRWMVLGAARESGGYVAKSFKLQYLAEDGTWVDADVVEGNQMNKVVRTLSQPITTTRVRLQIIQGEQNEYTTRIYEFAVYGYLKGEDPTGIDALPQDESEYGAWFNLSGQRVSNTSQPGVYVQKGTKVLKR